MMVIKVDLKFQVKNQVLKRIDSEKIVQKGKNIYRCDFTISGDIYEDLNIFAIFSDSWNNKKTVPLGKGNNLSCILPNFLLKGTFFKISLYSGDLITTNVITIPLLSSLYGNFEEYVECEEAESKDIFVQIFDKLDTKVDKLTVADGYLNIYKNDELVESIWMDTVNETFVRELVQSNVDEINAILATKSDIGHTHISADVTDLESEIDEDLDFLLLTLTEKINEI